MIDLDALEKDLERTQTADESTVARIYTSFIPHIPALIHGLREALAERDHAIHQTRICSREFNRLIARASQLERVREAATYYQQQRDAVRQGRPVRDMDEAREALRAALAAVKEEQ